MDDEQLLKRLLENVPPLLRPEAERDMRAALERGKVWGKIFDTLLPPYREWCLDPSLCAGKDYCPRDPTCGD